MKLDNLKQAWKVGNIDYLEYKLNPEEIELMIASVTVKTWSRKRVFHSILALCLLMVSCVG